MRWETSSLVSPTQAPREGLGHLHLPLSALRPAFPSCPPHCARCRPCLQGEIWLWFLRAAQDDPLRAGLCYSQEGNDPIRRSSPRHCYQGHEGKGFSMLYGWALWRASVLLLNHSRSTGKWSPFWWKKSVLFYVILSIPLSVKCTLPTVLHMGHMSSVRRALLLRTWRRAEVLPEILQG